MRITFPPSEVAWRSTSAADLNPARRRRTSGNRLTDIWTRGCAGLVESRKRETATGATT
jgi:hypothetical protein